MLVSLSLESPAGGPDLEGASGGLLEVCIQVKVCVCVHMSVHAFCLATCACCDSFSLSLCLYPL